MNSTSKSNPKTKYLCHLVEFEFLTILTSGHNFWHLAMSVSKSKVTIEFPVSCLTRKHITLIIFGKYVTKGNKKPFFGLFRHFSLFYVIPGVRKSFVYRQGCILEIFSGHKKCLIWREESNGVLGFLIGGQEKMVFKKSVFP